MSEALVRIHRDEPGVVTITLARAAKRNALSIELLTQLKSAVDASASDNRVMIIAAEGPAFCAGLDLEEASNPATAERSGEALGDLYEAIVQWPGISIAAAGGAAIGGGAALALACDLAIGADDLVMSFPEVHRGIIAALATALLRRAVSDRVARELILLGEPIHASRAIKLGLIHRITTRERMSESAMELARQALKGAPGAITRSRQLLDDLSARPILQQLRLARAHHLHARQSPEAIEGVAAFREKRRPKWEG